MSIPPNFAPIKPSLDKLQAIERELTASLIESDEVIRASLVALPARQRLVILGPPGTAKSALVTELAQRISPQNGAGLRNFAYLMTRFTTPEELFGPVSVNFGNRRGPSTSTGGLRGISRRSSQIIGKRSSLVARMFSNSWRGVGWSQVSSRERPID